MRGTLRLGRLGKAMATLSWAAVPATLAVQALLAASGCEYVAEIGDRKAELGTEGAGGQQDAGDDTPPIQASCVPGPAVIAATTKYGSPTALARVSTPTGKVWASLIGASDLIAFNEVDEGGALVFPSDVVLEQTNIDSDSLSSPRMVTAGSSYLMAYGRVHGGGSGTFVTTLRQFDPVTASFVGDEALGQIATVASRPRVASAVADGSGMRVLVSTILGEADLDPVREELFAAPPSRLRVDDSLHDARGAAAAWAPDAERFGVAMLTAEGGELQTFDRDLNQGASFTFATPQIDPPWGASVAPPAIVGIGRQLFVAWVRDDGYQKALRLNAMDALTGEPLSGSSVEVSTALGTDTTHPAYPKLLYDGQSLLVAWVRVDSDDMGDVHVQRYDLGLNRVGEELCPTCEAGSTMEGEFALANDGVGRFAVLFYAFHSTTHYVVEFDCTAP